MSAVVDEVISRFHDRQSGPAQPPDVTHCASD